MLHRRYVQRRPRQWLDWPSCVALSVPRPVHRRHLAPCAASSVAPARAPPFTRQGTGRHGTVGSPTLAVLPPPGESGALVPCSELEIQLIFSQNFMTRQILTKIYLQYGNLVHFSVRGLKCSKLPYYRDIFVKICRVMKFCEKISWISSSEHGSPSVRLSPGGGDAASVGDPTVPVSSGALTGEGWCARRCSGWRRGTAPDGGGAPAGELKRSAGGSFQPLPRPSLDVPAGAAFNPWQH